MDEIMFICHTERALWALAQLHERHRDQNTRQILLTGQEAMVLEFQTHRNARTKLRTKLSSKAHSLEREGH